MNRCARSSVAALTGLFLALAPLPAAAQVHRNFTAAALRGRMQFTNPPDVVLDGSAARLAPGMRIHGPDNMLVMSGAVVGQKFVVDYTLDSDGQVYEIWLLTATEAAVKPWPTSAAQASAWSFDYFTQTWTTP